MIISEQRKKDLEEATKLYLNGYQGDKFEVDDSFVEYASYYHLTNESFNKFLQIVNISPDSKTLSVLASGDQVFHLVNKDITNIDTFDINRLTEYYALGFKKRAIECLSFEEYNKLFEYYKDYRTRTHYCQNFEIEKYVIENCEEEYRWFWQELIARLKDVGFKASVFHFATDVTKTNINYKIANPFMADHEKYKRLQQQLLKAKIKFKQSSIKDLSNNFKQYDLIYLSNIMEYYNNLFEDADYPKEEAINLLKNIYDNNLNLNGEILLTELVGMFISIIHDNEFFKEHRYIVGRETSLAYTLKKEK